MSKLYLTLDEQGYVIGMGDNPDVYPRCIEASEWFGPGQHFKTGRVINGELVVDLDANNANANVVSVANSLRRRTWSITGNTTQNVIYITV